MKFDWRLALVAGAAALSLQACDVQVHSGSGSTTVQQPQASLPEDTKLNGQQTAAVTPPAEPSAVPAPEAAPAATPPAETVAQAPATDAPATAPLSADTTAQAPAQPDTSALGAGATPAAASTATTSAAPTELQKFFENTSPAAKAEKAAAKK